LHITSRQNYVKGPRDTLHNHTPSAGSYDDIFSFRVMNVNASPFHSNPVGRVSAFFPFFSARDRVNVVAYWTTTRYRFATDIALFIIAERIKNITTGSRRNTWGWSISWFYDINVSSCSGYRRACWTLVIFYDTYI